MTKGIATHVVWILVATALCVPACESRRRKRAFNEPTVPLTPTVLGLPAGRTMYEYLDARYANRQAARGFDLPDRPCPALEIEAGPLVSVFAHIAAVAEVPIEVMWGSLSQAGIKPEMPVTVSLPAGTVGEAMAGILASLGPAGRVEFEQNIHGVIEVATPGYFTGGENYEPRPKLPEDPSPAERARRAEDYRRVAAALATRCAEFAFWEAELQEVFQSVSDLTQMDVLVLWDRLDALGVKPDTPVNISLYDVTLDESLRVMLNNLPAKARVVHVVGIHQTLIILPASDAVNDTTGAIVQPGR